MRSPNEFRDHALWCFEKAKQASHPFARATLIERSRALVASAIEFERTFALQDSAAGPPCLASEARTLDHLKRDLARLSPGMSVRISIKEYCDLFPGGAVENAWTASNVIGDEFGC